MYWLFSVTFNHFYHLTSYCCKPSFQGQNASLIQFCEMQKLLWQESLLISAQASLKIRSAAGPSVDQPNQCSQSGPHVPLPGGLTTSAQL